MRQREGGRRVNEGERGARVSRGGGGGGGGEGFGLGRRQGVGWFF